MAVTAAVGTEHVWAVPRYLRNGNEASSGAAESSTRKVASRSTSRFHQPAALLGRGFVRDTRLPHWSSAGARAA